MVVAGEEPGAPVPGSLRVTGSPLFWNRPAERQEVAATLIRAYNGACAAVHKLRAGASLRLDCCCARASVMAARALLGAEWFAQQLLLKASSRRITEFSWFGRFLRRGSQESVAGNDDVRHCRSFRWGSCRRASLPNPLRCSGLHLTSGLRHLSVLRLCSRQCRQGYRHGSGSY